MHEDIEALKSQISEMQERNEIAALFLAGQ